MHVPVEEVVTLLTGTGLEGSLVTKIEIGQIRKRQRCTHYIPLLTSTVVMYLPVCELCVWTRTAAAPPGPLSVSLGVVDVRCCTRAAAGPPREVRITVDLRAALPPGPRRESRFGCSEDSSIGDVATLPYLKDKDYIFNRK